MSQSFKNVFSGLSAKLLDKHVREGIWYPSTAWGIVKDRQLGAAFLAYARRRMVHENVAYLMDLAKVPMYDTSLGSHQRDHFYRTYFRTGAGIYGEGGASLQLNLPGGLFVQAKALLAPASSRLDQLKNRLVGPSGSLSIVEFLVTVAHEVCETLDSNDDVRHFWASPEFAAIHAANLAHRRQVAAAAAQSKTPNRPHPVVRFT